jgi:hypothetical protein
MNTIKGKLVKVLPIESGISKAGKEWKKGGFVIDTGDQFNPFICFGLFGKSLSIIDGKTIGNELEVSFNISSREFENKWYSQIDAWKIDVVNNYSASEPSSYTAKPTPQAFDGESVKESDDLPF